MWSKASLTGLIITVVVFLGLCGFLATKLEVDSPVPTDTSNVVAILQGISENTTTSAWQLFLDSIDRKFHLGAYR